jgi:hypothetical protein
LQILAICEKNSLGKTLFQYKSRLLSKIKKQYNELPMPEFLKSFCVVATLAKGDLARFGYMAGRTLNFLL